MKKLENKRLSAESKNAVEVLAAFFESADSETINGAEKLFKSAVKRMQVKVEKDIEVMLNIDRPDNFVLPMTNRSNVSILFYFE